MFLPKPQDAIHKAWLYRLLSAIYDDSFLASSLYFKGGTCAAMLGYLDRFSVDLDFDYVAKKDDMAKVRKNLEKVFKKLGLEIKDKSSQVPQYFLKYSTVKEKQKNTIKIDVTMPPPDSNSYETKRFDEIDRIINCQTKETMFANKMVALIDRYEKNDSIAGRDLYDIHHFFLQGFEYDQEVIKERRGTDVITFFDILTQFINTTITQKIINQDLNTLLPFDKFKRIRGIIKKEVLLLLNDERKRLV